MKTRTICFCLMLVVALTLMGNAQAQSQSSPYTPKEVYEKFYGPVVKNLTPLQKSLLVDEKLRYKYVKGEGTVEDVTRKDMGLLGAARWVMSVAVTDASIINRVNLVISNESLPMAAPMKKGDRVSFIGQYITFVPAHQLPTDAGKWEIILAESKISK